MFLHLESSELGRLCAAPSHTQGGGGFLIVLFREAGLGSGSPHTPKAVTLMDSFPRAQESALDIRGGPGPDLAASRVFHRGPESAVPDADVEGPRIPTTRRESPCPASLAISKGFAFAFLRLSHPVNNQSFRPDQGESDRDPGISPSSLCTNPTHPTVGRNQPHGAVQWQALGTYSPTFGHRGPSSRQLLSSREGFAPC